MRTTSPSTRLTTGAAATGNGGKMLFDVNDDSHIWRDVAGTTATHALSSFIRSKRGWNVDTRLSPTDRSGTTDDGAAWMKVVKLRNNAVVDSFVVWASPTGKADPAATNGSVNDGRGGVAWVTDDGGRDDSLPDRDGIRGDCVNRALAIATDTPFRKVRQMLTDQMAKGKHRDTNPDNGVWPSDWHPVAKALGLVQVKCDSPKSVRDTLNLFPNAVLSCRSHIMAAVDGQVRDTWDSTRKRVKSVWVRPADVPAGVR